MKTPPAYTRSARPIASRPVRWRSLWPLSVPHAACGRLFVYIFAGSKRWATRAGRSASSTALLTPPCPKGFRSVSTREGGRKMRREGASSGRFVRLCEKRVACGPLSGSRALVVGIRRSDKEVCAGAPTTNEKCVFVNSTSSSSFSFRSAERAVINHGRCMLSALVWALSRRRLFAGAPDS